MEEVDFVVELSAIWWIDPRCDVVMDILRRQGGGNIVPPG